MGSRWSASVVLAALAGAGCTAASPCPSASAAAAPPRAPETPLPPSSEPKHGDGVPFAVVRRSNYRLAFGPFAVEVDPVDGARIVEFSLAGRSILVPIEESPEAFGSSLWTSPQSDWRWPPPAALDRLPWQVLDDPRSVVLQSGISEELALSVRQRITAEPATGSLRLDYEFTHHGSRPRSFAPWQNTRVRARGLSFYPASRPSYDLEQATLRLEPTDGIVWYLHQPDRVSADLKSLGDGEEGWMAQLDGRLLFLKIFDDVPPARQAPGEGEIVLYVARSGRFVEMENQGAYAELAPSASRTWTVIWALRQLPDAIRGTPGEPALVDFAREVVREVRQAKAPRR